MFSLIMDISFYPAVVVMYLLITVFMKKYFLLMTELFLGYYPPTEQHIRYCVALAFFWPITFFIMTILWLAVYIFTVVDR